MQEKQSQKKKKKSGKPDEIEMEENIVLHKIRFIAFLS